MSELAKVRRSKGFSQRALAAEAGVSPSSVYEIEVGRRRANPSTLRKIADALGVEVADLLEEEERPKGAGPPLSLEWARKADLDLLRLVIRDAPSEQLREIGAALVADFYRVQTREELVEEGPTPRGQYVDAFTRAGIISEELRRRGEESLEQHVLTLKRRKDPMTGGEEAAHDQSQQVG